MTRIRWCGGIALGAWAGVWALLAVPSAVVALTLELTHQERAWIQQHPEIRVRVSDFPPFHFVEQGRPQGISVDMMGEIAEAAGFRLRFIPHYDWDEALTAIREHRDFDLLLTAKRTPERSRDMNFTRDYLNLPWVVFTRDDAPFVSSAEDLAGWRVAVEEGYVMHDLLAQRVPDAQLIPVAGLALEALSRLSAGEADAYVGNLTVGSYLIGQFGFTNIKVAAPAGFGSHDQAMAVRNDWPELVSILDKGLQGISPAERNRIFQRWLSVSVEYGLEWRTVAYWAALILLPLLFSLAIFVVWSSRLRREAAQRRKVEKALQQSEERYRDLFSNMRSGVAVYEPDGDGFRFVDFNRAAERINETTASEVLGRRVEERFPQVESFGLLEVFRQVHQSGEPRELPVTVYQDERLEKWIENYVYRLSDGCVVAIHDDLTEIRRAEQELQRSSESLRRAQAIAHIGNWDWNIRTGGLRWSDEIYRIFGLEPQQFAATYEAFLDHVHPEDRRRLAEAVERAVADPGEVYRIEHRVLRPSGEVREVVEVGDVYRDDSGKGIYMTGTVRDITEQKRIEENLRLAQKVIQSAGEAILITDAASNIIDVNPAYERIMGYHRDEIIGKNPRFVSSGRHGPEFYRDMWGKLSAAGFWEGEVWDRRKDGEVFPQWLTINAIHNEEGKVSHYVGMFLDISRQKATEEKLEELAFYDPLTGLPNRTLSLNRLRHGIKVCHRKGCRLALLFIDLDRFKGVNDTLGHAAGDELLQQLAGRLKSELREMDTVARLGGDEFTILISDLDSPDELSPLADKLIARIREPVMVRGRLVHVGASIGIAVYPDDAQDAGNLLKYADMAMYQAKEAGRNTYKYFSPVIQSRVQDRVALEEDLHEALEHGWFDLFYQPKVQLEQRKIIGAEALVRWMHPQRGMVGPDQFIPLAEETGLIMQLGELVLRKACIKGAQWARRGCEPFRIAVNLSARQFHADDIVEMVRDTLERSGLPPERLELEITESAVMVNVEEAIGIMRGLRELGVSLAIDDFGTGYSSLNYLKRFPINTLKIDKSFVLDLHRDGGDAAIVAAVISLASSLGLNVIAEGIENEAQLAFLIERKCREGQGYLLGKPMPEREFEALCGLSA